MTKDEELIERIDRMLLASPVDEYTTMIAVEPDDLREIRNRLEALARPVVGVPDPVQEFEDYWAASKYCTRNMIGYSDKKCLAWEAYSAALAASPAPVVGDREAIARTALSREEKDAILAYMERHCPHRAKETAWDAVSAFNAVLSLSTPVVGGEFVQNFRDAVGEDAWLSIPAYLQNWIIAKALATHKAMSPDPHTTDRAGMAQEVE